MYGLQKAVCVVNLTGTKAVGTSEIACDSKKKIIKKKTETTFSVQTYLRG